MNSPAIPSRRPFAADSKLPVLVKTNPAFEFLVAVLGSPDDKNGILERLISEGMNWKQFLRLAEEHRVIPQVFASLSGLKQLCPNEVREQLRKRYDANVRQTLRLSGDLLRILKHFESRQISVLPYKGPVLGNLAYGDAAARQYSDLDLLVRPHDVARAELALNEVGYKKNHHGSPSKSADLKSGYEYTFDSKDARNVVELQWRILPRFYSVEFDIEKLFERARRMKLNGYPLQTLSSEDLLLVLCVHAAKHQWTQLSYLCDIGHLMQSQNLNWGGVFQSADELGIRRILDLNLSMVKDLLEINLPAVKAVEIIPINPRLRRRVERCLEGEHGPVESLSYFRLLSEVRERRRDRFRFWWRLLWTPGIGDWSAIQLPAGLYPLYRFVRVYRLAYRAYRRPHAKPAASETIIGRPEENLRGSRRGKVSGDRG